MLNRLRISTTLFLILIVCSALQIGSNGLSFWAFRDDFQNLKRVEISNQQRDTLTQSRAALLQASNVLNRAGTLTALSYPPDDVKRLMANARSSLKQADMLFNQFLDIPQKDGDAEKHSGIGEISAGNNDLSARTEPRPTAGEFAAAGEWVTS